MTAEPIPLINWTLREAKRDYVIVEFQILHEGKLSPKTEVSLINASEEALRERITKLTGFKYFRLKRVR